MKYIIVVIIILSSLSYSQQRKHYSSEKWVTEVEDTLVYSNQTTYGVHLIVTSDSLSSNLLQFRTNLESTWRTLLPNDASYSYPSTAGKYLIRKSLTDSVYSRAWAD